MPDRFPRPPAPEVKNLCSAALAVAYPAGLTSVCLSRVIDERPRGVIWASDDRARQLDDLQVVLGEGPAVTALAEGGPVMVTDLSVQSRYGWVTFERSATQLDVRSICAFPLHIGAVRLGALTLHGTQPACLDPTQLDHQLALCRDLSIAVLATEAGSENWSRDHDRAMEDPTLAITSRAAGMVMVQLDTTIAAAMSRLCAHAFAADLSLEAVSRSVVERTLRFHPDRF